MVSTGRLHRDSCDPAQRQAQSFLSARLVATRKSCVVAPGSQTESLVSGSAMDRVRTSLELLPAISRVPGTNSWYAEAAAAVQVDLDDAFRMVDAGVRDSPP